MDTAGAIERLENCRRHLDGAQTSLDLARREAGVAVRLQDWRGRPSILHLELHGILSVLNAAGRRIRMDLLAFRTEEGHWSGQEMPDPNGQEEAEASEPE